MRYLTLISRYVKVLRDERHRLNKDTIHKIMVTKCYYSRLDEEEFSQKKALELVKKEYNSYTRKKK